MVIHVVSLPEMHALPENDLIKKAQEGHPLAFRYLVERHQQMTYTLAYRFLNDSDDAKDIVQEAFIRLWKNLDKYKPEIKLSTWLYKITTNLCLDKIKSKHHQQRNHQVRENYELPDPSNPVKEMEQEELARIIHQAAQALTPKQQAVFILRDLHGLSTQEIEDTLNMSSEKIKSNLYYARIAMQEKLKKIFFTPSTPIHHEL